ncbi:MAG: hypothetical protein WDN06_12945 [Asticcacaulis sp.]
MPPVSKEVALGQVIDGDKVMSLPAHVTHKASFEDAPSPVRESRTPTRPPSAGRSPSAGARADFRVRGAA